MLSEDNFFRNKPEHPYFWWAVKVACGICLILGMIVRFVFNQSEPVLDVPIAFAQSLVIVGVTSYLYHYYLVMRDNSNMSSPEKLVSQRGLFRWIRHPMYLSDMVYYLGMALLCASYYSLALIAIAYFALIKQAIVEDGFVAERFPIQHKEWGTSSYLIIPFLR